MTKERKTTQLPEFKSEEEASAFWDTHSPEDFPGEFEPVEVKFSHPLIKRGLTVKLSEETIDELRKLGQEKGVGPTTLVRMWILEHLSGEKGRGIAS
ncbi:MAG: CopG family antitoxin [Dehalococcoidia bacterium]|nr:CopG family antitoxin [Dehalococcoidia bacterium]